jgi:hypothetical protein
LTRVFSYTCQIVQLMLCTFDTRLTRVKMHVSNCLTRVRHCTRVKLHVSKCLYFCSDSYIFSKKIKAKNKSDKERKRTHEEIPRGIETHHRGTRHREAERGCNRTRAPVLRSKSAGVLLVEPWLGAKGKRKIEARQERKMKMYRAGFGSQMPKKVKKMKVKKVEKIN